MDTTAIAISDIATIHDGIDPDTAYGITGATITLACITTKDATTGATGTTPTTGESIMANGIVTTAEAGGTDPQRVGAGTPMEEPDATAALDAFLAEVSPRAYRMAALSLDDREEARDVVNDSALRLVQYYRGKGPDEWPALFFTILQNRINDVLRQRTRRGRLARIVSLHGSKGEDADRGDPLEPPGAVTDRPDEALSGQQIGDAIAAALRALPQSQQHAFILREWQGLSIRETAQVLGCTENTVKQHHFRALRRLRGLLEEVWAHV